MGWLVVRRLRFKLDSGARGGGSRVGGNFINVCRLETSCSTSTVRS